MTLMAIDPTQSQAHKGSFLQGGKVSNINHQHNNNKNSASPPPITKQQQQQNNHNNNRHNDTASNNKRNSSDSDSGISSCSSNKSSRSSLSSTCSNNNNNNNSSNGNNASSRYKTELCRPFEERGVCKYGDKCQFAHGPKELRTLVRHPKYKTELCRTFHTTGLCPYGPRCHFIHNSEQTKKTLLTSLTRNSSPTESKSFSDLYHQNGRSSSTYEYKSDDKVFYDVVDNYSFHQQLAPSVFSDLVPPPSPLQKEVGFASSMFLPIFNGLQPRLTV